jgi:hypothetical protein
VDGFYGAAWLALIAFLGAKKSDKSVTALEKAFGTLN